MVVVRVVGSVVGGARLERAVSVTRICLRQRQHRFHPGCVRFIEPIYRLLFGVGSQSAKCIDVSYTD